MQDQKPRSAAGYEAVEDIPDVGTRGETVNDTWLSVVSPTSPHGHRLGVLHCWHVLGAVQNTGSIGMAPGGVGGDFLIRRLRCRCSADLSSSVILAAHTPWDTEDFSASFSTQPWVSSATGSQCVEN